MKSIILALVCMIILAPIFVVCDKSSDDFADAKQAQVQDIADQAVKNDANKCELVQTCQIQNCSRRECYPYRLLDQQASCVYQSNNGNCKNNATGSICNAVLANLKSGYVRTPPFDLKFASTVESFVGETMCTQRALDPKFVEIDTEIRSSNSSANSYFYNLYLGSVDGSFRSFPGREIQEARCNIYDPRIRPWYMGAISVVKDLVVMVDVASYMQIEFNGLVNFSTPLEVAKSMTQALMKTLTPGDRATIIPFNDSADPLMEVPPNFFTSGALNLSGTPFNQFLESLDEPPFSNPPSSSSGSSSNFTTGFVQALSILNDSQSPSDSLKIVVLMTTYGGDPPSTRDLETATSGFSEQGPRLFVYELGNNSDASWPKLACQVGGFNEKLEETVAYGNPLYSLRSYFSFLARSRRNVNQELSFWQPKYTDASSLGDIITVAYPAISADGELIGVAGIDVQLAGLDPVLEQALEEILPERIAKLITHDPGGASFNRCNVEYTGNRTESACGDIAKQVFCPQDYEASFTSLACCGDCYLGRHRHRPNLKLILGVSLGAVTMFAFMVVIWKLFFPKKPQERDVSVVLLNKYSYEELRKATGNFDNANIIGRGGFGVVYKAIVRDEHVAVKSLHRPADFQAELNVLQVRRHTNLVELKGTCFQATECFLVYELVEGGDLESWLWPKPSEPDIGDGRFLTWSQRKQIARGTARGLNYLHKGLPSRESIFHLDIKPSNILLDDAFNPKIADFGLSQIYKHGYTMNVAAIKKGTLGYLPPEVTDGDTDCKPTFKVDVYSYGMVLLQLVSGRKLAGAKPNLLQWARGQERDGNAERVVDKRLLNTVMEEYQEALLNNCITLINLALRCLDEDPDVRPDMSEVLDTIDRMEHVIDLKLLESSDNETRDSKLLQPDEYSSFLVTESWREVGQPSGIAEDGSPSSGLSTLVRSRSQDKQSNRWKAKALSN